MTVDRLSGQQPKRKNRVSTLKESAYHEMSSVEDQHWWFVGRRERAESILTELKFTGVSPNAPAEILEVGCGIGGNLTLLNKFGIVTALEPNAIALGYCREKHENMQLLLMQGTADEIPTIFPDKKFDLICMFDVLEHIEFPVEALKILHESLRNESSCLLISVPAFQFLWSSHDVNLMHKRRYSKNTLRRELEAAGFKVEMSSGFNLIFLPVLVALRYLHKLKVLANDPGTKIPRSPVNWLLKKTLKVETLLAQHFTLPAGVSIFLVARQGQ